MGDIVIDYGFDERMYVDYIGSDIDHKIIVRNIFETLYKRYENKEIQELALTLNVTGAFLTISIENKKIRAHVHNFIERYVTDMEEFVDNEKKSNQHD